MLASRVPKSVAPGTNPYGDVLYSTRPLSAAQWEQRQRWFEQLSSRGEHSRLLRCEASLRALVALGYAPFQANQSPERWFAAWTCLLKTALMQMQSVLQPSASSWRLMRLGTQPFESAPFLASAESGPEDALRQLMHELRQLSFWCRRMAALGTIKKRDCLMLHTQFIELLRRSAFFDLSEVLDVCPEYDSIRHPHLLAIIRRLKGEQHALVTRALLVLSRLLDYLEWLHLEPTAESSRSGMRLSLRIAFLYDLHTLGEHLRRVAQGRLSASRYDASAKEGDALRELGYVLAYIGTVCSIESKALPDVLWSLEEQALPPAYLDGLRVLVHRPIRHFYHELRGIQEPGELTLKHANATAILEKDYRDLWILQKLTQAFVCKAEAWLTKPSNDWNHAPCAWTYAQCMRSFGYALLRAHQYDAYNEVRDSINTLAGCAVIDLATMGGAAEHSKILLGFLERTLAQLLSRLESYDTYFDVNHAHRVLGHYLELL